MKKVTLIALGILLIVALKVAVQPSNSIQSSHSVPPTISGSQIVLHGPRFAAGDAPQEYGFWSYAVVKEGILSRSGQPNLTDFTYLKNHGYKTIINLRYPGEYDEETDDRAIDGVSSLGFEHITLPIEDGGIPTDEQARRFLELVKDSAHYPIHVHCRAGFGRTGVMVALYRYEVDGWPMEQAIAESRLFEGGVSDRQKNWLLSWVNTR